MHVLVQGIREELRVQVCPWSLPEQMASSSGAAPPLSHPCQGTVSFPGDPPVASQVLTKATTLAWSTSMQPRASPGTCRAGAAVMRGSQPVCPRLPQHPPLLLVSPPRPLGVPVQPLCIPLRVSVHVPVSACFCAALCACAMLCFVCHCAHSPVWLVLCFRKRLWGWL